MKIENENVQLERRTLIHESSTFFCLCIVKRPTSYALRMSTPFKGLVKVLSIAECLKGSILQYF